MAFGINLERLTRKSQHVVEQVQSVPQVEQPKQKERKTKPAFTSDQSKVIGGVLCFDVGGNWYSMDQLLQKHPRIYAAAHADGSLHSSLLSTIGL